MNMKKYSIIFPLVVVIFLSGCNKLTEDPRGNLTPDSYFQTQADLDASVTAIYQQMTFDGAYAATMKSTSYFGSDDFTTDPGLNKGDFRAFDQLNGSSSTQLINAQWSAPWTIIYQANNVITNYQKVKSTDELKNRAVGQAYYLRAQGYYFLVRTFGPIPVIDSTIAVDFRPDRSPVEDVYKLIISDLEMAKSLLPVKFEGEPGRANQMAARSLLADVYLTMTGWPVQKPDYYPLAAQEAKAIIESNEYTLVPNFGEVFKTNNNSESIFGVQFNISANSPNRMYGCSCVPLDEVAADGSSGWNDFYPEINFFLRAPACERTDETFYTELKLRQPDNSFKLVDWSSSETHGGHPYYKKFRAGVNNDAVNETPTVINSMSPSSNKTTDIIRYPMVLLDFAEASAMADGAPSDEAYNAIDMVRERAGLPNLTKGLSAEAFRDSVVYERAYEFAGEFGMRWFDIVRLQLLPKILAERSDKENPILFSGDLGSRYYAPIPINELYRNPNWTQNAGY